MRTVVLTVSGPVSRREVEDLDGPRLAHLAELAGAEVVAMEVVPADAALIEDRLRHYVDDDVRFILTTGGTGIGPDDVTPEATRPVLERELPGIAEAIRARGLQEGPSALLSRAVAGISGRTLIVNLPGDPETLEHLFGVLGPTLRHVGSTLARERGRPVGH